MKAKMNLLPMQAGDVPLLGQMRIVEAIDNYKPTTEINVGVRKFVKWYREYYNV